MAEITAVYEEKARVLAEYRAHIHPETIVTGRCSSGRVLHVWQEWHDQPAICGSRVLRDRWSTQWSFGTPLCPQCLRRMRRTLEQARQAPGR